MAISGSPEQENFVPLEIHEENLMNDQEIMEEKLHQFGQRADGPHYQNLNINFALINPVGHHESDPGLLDFFSKTTKPCSNLPDLYRLWAKFFLLLVVLRYKSQRTELLSF